MMRLLGLVTLACFSGGCAAAVSITTIWSAQAAVEVARQAGAERRAPYELAGAEAYVHEAREADGYAQFAASVHFARQAAEMARVAAAKAAQTPDPNGPLCAPLPAPTPAASPAVNPKVAP